ncbi:hypothetical protein [Amycolatopsis sp. WGS_07]|uniref:hypothetical protein n=1 Tax=Amycolatopsis sp. WGS_07 TaxID=3076764 RepID=UPI0038734D93
MPGHHLNDANDKAFADLAVIPGVEFAIAFTSDGARHTATDGISPSAAEAFVATLAACFRTDPMLASKFGPGTPAERTGLPSAYRSFLRSTGPTSDGNPAWCLQINAFGNVDTDAIDRVIEEWADRLNGHPDSASGRTDAPDSDCASGRRRDRL